MPEPLDSLIYCPLRKRKVLARPEEAVRVKLIYEMTEKLGYPLSSLALEKELSFMPHLALEKALPKRRLDLICFAKGIHPEYDLYPLLLIECKAVKLTPKMIPQVTGYNKILKAYFFALVNSNEIQFGRVDPKNGCYQFINRIPHYHELMPKRF